MVRPSADLYTLRAIPRINSSHVRVLGRLSAMRTFRKLLFSPKVPREPQTPASKPPRPNEENLRRSFKEGRYQVIRKLGFGVYSTVWLCRDHWTSQFVALKILHADSTKGIPTQPKEADILQHIAQADPSHSGHQHVVKTLDSFMHVGPHGEHSCIVFQALGESVLNLQKRSENGRLSLDFVRSIARQTLLGLDYLHRSCRLVHTVDLQTGNILLDVEAQTIINSQPQGAEDVVTGTGTDSYVSLPSQPLAFTDKQLVKVKITDFGVANWTLIRIPTLQPTSPERLIRVVYPELDPGEAREFAAFMEAVMKEDPATRPTAAELLEHP